MLDKACKAESHLLFDFESPEFTYTVFHSIAWYFSVLQNIETYWKMGDFDCLLRFLAGFNAIYEAFALF